MNFQAINLYKKRYDSKGNITQNEKIEGIVVIEIWKKKPCICKNLKWLIENYPDKKDYSDKVNFWRRHILDITEKEYYKMRGLKENEIIRIKRMNNIYELKKTN